MKFKVGDEVYCSRYGHEGVIIRINNGALYLYPIVVDTSPVAKTYTLDGRYHKRIEPSLQLITKLYRLLKEVDETES